ncbi:hypothetical protein CAEBREN_02213 [Caenorhabditis brenneri]|uniref:Uncharacterized protein n=1 Tax=Caenorhabditis brenneri TaxID=135651 RepID=G0MW26_CAEBE|nr:hypothetical protein CAEBREN_02213 [Caenorhabditis brenneri]
MGPTDAITAQIAHSRALNKTLTDGQLMAIRKYAPEVPVAQNSNSNYIIMTKDNCAAGRLCCARFYTGHLGLKEQKCRECDKTYHTHCYLGSAVLNRFYSSSGNAQ